MTKLRTGRIRALAKHIENPKTAQRYDQTNWGHCKTPLCVAGHTVWLWGDYDRAIGFLKGKRGRRRSDCFSSQAQQILGLTSRQANALFKSSPMYQEHGVRPTRHNAARALRTLAKTGTPDWGTKRLYKRDPLV